VSQVQNSYVRWRLVTLLFLLSAVTYLDRVNLSIAGPSLLREYHLTEIQLGWMFSAFLVGYGLLQAPAGRLADRIGARRALTGGSLWWAVFTVLTAVVPVGIRSGLWLLILVRFLLGCGEAILYPASTLIVKRWIPSEERGRANGLIFAGVGVGAGVTPPIIAYMMLHYGWRSSFWACTVIGLFFGCLWFYAARDTPEEHPGVSASEFLLIAHAHEEENSTPSPEHAAVPWSEILASWNVWAITVSYFCFGYVAWLFFSWFYIYIAEQRGLNLKSSALYATLPFIAMAVGSVVGGVLSDRITESYGKRLGRCSMAAAALTLAAIFLVAGTRVEGTGLAAVILSGGAGTLYLAQSSFWSVATDIADGASGSVSGFMNMGAQAGGAVTASLTPWIALHFGWNTSFLASAGLAVLGAGLWLTINPNRSLAIPVVLRGQQRSINSNP
jgi:MFS transporter, ACS family, glucarate transporter